MSTKSSRNLAASKAAKKFDVWYPKASELELPGVPADQRAAVRAKLAPVLANLKPVDWLLGQYAYTDPRLGVKQGDCWSVNQAVMLTANDPSFVYVEGAWEFLDPKKTNYAIPAPHGWVTINGHIVDLLAERLVKTGEKRKAEYEPLKTFTHDELRSILEDFGDWEVVSRYLWEQDNWHMLPEHLKENVDYTERNPDGYWGSPEQRKKQEQIDEERTDFTYNTAFKPAVERLAARLEAEGKARVREVVPEGMEQVFDFPPHEEGTPICILHHAFEEAGFCIHQCPCGCDQIGYTTHVPYLLAVGMYEKVMAAIKNVPELRQDYRELKKAVRETLQLKGVALYMPETFKFTVRLEAKPNFHCVEERKAIMEYDTQLKAAS